MHTATKPRTLAAALMTALMGGIDFQAKTPAVRGQRGAARLGNAHPTSGGQHRNPIRAERRALVAAIGRRQGVKQIKRERRAAILAVQAGV